MENSYLTIEYLLDSEENFMLFCKAIHNELDPYNTGVIDSSKFFNCMNMISEMLRYEIFSNQDLEKISKLINLDCSEDEYLDFHQFCKIVRILFENHLKLKLTK